VSIHVDHLEVVRGEPIQWRARNLTTTVGCCERTYAAKKGLQQSRSGFFAGDLDELRIEWRPAARDDTPFLRCAHDPAQWVRLNDLARLTRLCPSDKDSPSFRITGMALRHHAVHLAPVHNRLTAQDANLPQDQGSQRLDLGVDLQYDVVRAGNAVLYADSGLRSGWRGLNLTRASCGTVGTWFRMLAPQTALSLSSRGTHHARLTLATANGLSRGVCCVIATGAFAGREASGRSIGRCRPELGYDRDGRHMFRHDLWFVAADLDGASLQLADLRTDWRAGSLFDVALVLSERSGQHFYVPRADVTASTWQRDKPAVQSLTAQFGAGQFPQGRFAGRLPQGPNVCRIKVAAALRCCGPNGEFMLKTEKTWLPDTRRAPETTPWRPRRGADGILRETRVLFAHTNNLVNPKRIDMLVDLARRANMNVILAQCTGQGVFWRSRVALPFQRPLSFDPLGRLIEKAHAAGMEVQVTLDCFHVIRPSYVVPGVVTDPMLRFQTMVGLKPARGRICTHDPKYRQWFGSVVQELCRNYEIDGINLDTIRTGNGGCTANVCLCSSCRRDYLKRYGAPLEKAKGKNFIQWQCAGTSALVKLTRETMDRVRPGLRLSICAFVPQSPSHPAIQGQPAHEWVERGWLDFLLPMVYSLDVAGWVYPHTMDYERAMPEPSVVMPLLTTMGHHVPKPLEHKALPPGCICDAIQAVREQCKSAGVGLYYASYLNDDLVEPLRTGPFRERARPLWRQ